MNEIWKQLEDYPDYEVSNLGRIKSNKRKNPIIIKQVKDSTGYYAVHLWNNNKNVHKRVHTLVLEGFVGKRFDGMDASHLDNNKENNNLINLIWESHEKNTQRREGIKLNIETASEIRVLLKRGFTIPIISDIYGICERQIYDIKNNKAWRAPCGKRIKYVEVE